MQGATEPQPRYGTIALAILLVPAALAGVILGKESGPGEPMKTPMLNLAATIGMYDTAANRDQCLTNVRDITRAIQMYLTDYGKLPPQEHAQDVIGYFGEREPHLINCRKVTGANPYLRWPVVLEEYMRSRRAWSCPSARLGVGTLWIVPGPGWLGHLKRNDGKWGKATGAGVGPCIGAWPPGWGGSVTDSITQGMVAVPGEPPSGSGAFRQSIGYAAAYELTRAQVADPAWFVVCGDSRSEVISSPTALAYPDVCRLRMGGDAIGCGADWENCPWTQGCGLSESALKHFWVDAKLRRRYTRHLGGTNIGYLDGHAAWMSADDIIANSPTSRDEKKGRLRGIGCLCLGMPGE